MDDVLSFYMPHINWTRFNRGDVPNSTWDKFKDVILLCHAAVHWEREFGEARNTRMQGRPPSVTTKADEETWQLEGDLEIHRAEMHMRRANFLATKKYWRWAKRCPPNMTAARAQNYLSP